MADPDEEYTGKSAYCGKIATQYDEDRMLEPIWAREQDFVDAWVKTLPAGRKILDVPAGTGRFLDFFHQHGLKVTAIDVSADMVAEIRRRCPDTAKAITITVGDAERLNIPDDEMDYIVSWRFFHLIPASIIDRVLLEFHRVCRGTVVVQVFAVQPSFWRRLRGAISRRLSPAAVPSVQSSPPTPWSHINSFCHRESDLRRRFKKAGFSLTEAVTLEAQEGQANRVFFLQRSNLK